MSLKRKVVFAVLLAVAFIGFRIWQWQKREARNKAACVKARETKKEVRALIDDPTFPSMPPSSRVEAMDLLRKVKEVEDRTCP